MRQNNQNQNKQRMRGRGGRKGPNPLTRTYDSNGPDVKVRGTAHHIAEKYQQLARDSQASGDRIMAENYLQHAEHYLRIVAAAQPANQQQHQSSRSGSDNSDRDQQNPSTDNPISVPVMAADAPQPVVDGIPDFNQKHGGNGSVAPLAEHDREGAGKVNGSSEAATGEDEESRPRRRTRGSRGRGLRRSSQNNRPGSEAVPGVEGMASPSDSDDKAHQETKAASESQPETGDAGEDAPAPKRRRRPAKPPVEAAPAEETAAKSSETEAGETGSTDPNPAADHLAG